VWKQVEEITYWADMAASNYTSEDSHVPRAWRSKSLTLPLWRYQEEKYDDDDDNDCGDLHASADVTW
jgi:hypothetical protein